MSFSKIPIKRKVSYKNSLSCIFCDNFENLVQNPKSESFLTVQAAATRRKDHITEKFKSLYECNATKQKFSWHKSCFSTYVSEQKIRLREIKLYKQELNQNAVDIASTTKSLGSQGY